MRFATFDIECTQLEATFGRLVCACFKFDDEAKPRSLRCPRVRNEPAMLKKLCALYDKADVIITQNGKMFDLPFVNARLMHHYMDILDPKKMHIDIRWQSAKLRFRGASLDGMAKDLRCKHQKYEVPGWRWVHAAEGDKEAIDEIVKHCEQDVLITEEVFIRLKPLLVRITR